MVLLIVLNPEGNIRKELRTHLFDFKYYIFREVGVVALQKCQLYAANTESYCLDFYIELPGSIRVKKIPISVQQKVLEYIV